MTNFDKKKIFISYNHKDRIIARRLQIDLEANGFFIWLDEKEVDPGDSIINKIEEGLKLCDVFLLLISEASHASHWVTREYESALSVQLSSTNNSPKIIPILIDSCEPPLLIKSIKWLSIQNSYVTVISEFISSFGISKPYIRTDRLLYELEELKKIAANFFTKYAGPSHDYFDKAEQIEAKFNEIRRCIASVQPLILDRHYWLIFGQEHLPLQERTFDLESFPVALLYDYSMRVLNTITNYDKHPDFIPMLSAPIRGYFGSSGGGKNIEENTYNMICYGEGIFHEAPFDGGKPYVEVGSKIESKTVMCMIESNGTVSEMLNCGGDGIVAEICVKEGDKIDKNTVLFKIKKPI